MPYILATAGHVDHGKSSLVRALTGTDPDRLPEEKARGITIDLGFAHLDLPLPRRAGESEARIASCGIVDVPGHEDFVRNMVAGVGAVDLALLVVAVDDGWMPQTEEHLQILLHLGVRRAVIALAKIDLAPDENAVRDAIRRRLAATPFAEAPLVPTSVVTGRGLDDLRAALAATLAGTPEPPDLGKPRLWVDRVFALKGVGTIVTGTLLGGCFERGQPVVAQPGARPGRIRGCHTFGRDVPRVTPGTRVALNLADLAVGVPGQPSPASVHRGDAIALAANPGDATETLDVLLEKSARLAAAGHSSPASRPLKSGTRVAFHLGSACIPGVVHLLESVSLAPGESVLAQLRLDHPVAAFAGDAFLLRDASQQATLAGGRVLDPDSRRAGAREPARLARLHECVGAPDDPAPFLRAQMDRVPFLPLSLLLPRARFTRKEILAALGRLTATNQVVLAGSNAARADWWNTVCQQAGQAIDDHHRTHPELAGLPLVDLRPCVASACEAFRGEAFSELVRALTRLGFETEGAVLRRAGHFPALPPDLQAPGHRIRQILDRRRLDPPGRPELAPDAASRKALAYLVQTGELVEVGAELVVSRKALGHATDTIGAHLRKAGTATTGELRELLGTTRRVVVPLLEMLDRRGFTRREGDRRSLRPS